MNEISKLPKGMKELKNDLNELMKDLDEARKEISELSTTVYDIKVKINALMEQIALISKEMCPDLEPAEAYYKDEDMHAVRARPTPFNVKVSVGDMPLEPAYYATALDIPFSY
jgi:uncharacterized coiled-coil DUF342 family protein